MFALYFEFTFWFVFQKNCRDLWLSIIFSLTSSVSFGSLTALYLIYLLLFNFQGPSCLPLAWGFALLRDSYIISYSEAFVKGFCKSFWSFFRGSVLLNLMFASFLLPARTRFRLPSLPRLTRPLYYIIFSWVCQEVLQKFFEVFFVNLSGSVSWPRCFCLSRSQL